MEKSILDRLFKNRRAKEIPDARSTFGAYAVGSLIGGKYLVQRVFEGGLGRAFVVTEASGIPFVLKAPRRGNGDQFLIEARTWIGLGRHANIVPAFWADRVAGMPCVAAELIRPDSEGRTSLRDRLRGHGPSVTQALRWGAQFCDAMEHAHSKGLKAHRDIKPENMLVSSAGDLQLTDFGISTAGDPMDDEVTSISGTPPYMSPEQWQGEPQDFRTDVYAFAVVLFEICFGRLPWSAHSVPELRAECLSTSYFETPAKHPLNFVIGVMSARDVGQRPATPAQLRLLLSMGANAVSTALPPPAAPIDIDKEQLLAEASLSLTGDDERAIVAARKLTEDWPDFAAGWTQLGRLLLQRGQLREAALATQHSIDLDPTRTAPWNNMGLILSRAGHHREALEVFDQALDSDPGNTGAMSNIANSLQTLGRSEEAIAYLERASKLAPDKLTIWLNLGSLLHVTGQFRKADECFHAALRMADDADRDAILSIIRRLAPAFCPDHG